LREITCRMVVIHRTTADDPKIVLPPGRAGAAARRIELRCDRCLRHEFAENARGGSARQ